MRDHIRINDLKVGDTLPGEGAFAERLGVSRAVMREAFSTLAALRQIDVGNGRKARVAELDGIVLSTSLDHAIATRQITVAEIWDVRRTLELRTSELAAMQRSDIDARLIIGHAEAMAAARTDLPQLIRHDIAFHQSIAKASGNALFFSIIRSFEALMAVAVPTTWEIRATDRQRQAALDNHRNTAQAIADRDPIAARGYMDQHFHTSNSATFVMQR